MGSRKGQALTESALVLLPLLMLFLGIIDTSLALWVRATMEHAAREGARYAITYGTRQGMGHSASIKQTVASNSMGLLQTSDVTVTFFDGSNPSVTSTNAPGNIVVVTAERNWFWIARSIMSSSGTVRFQASSADRMEGLGAGITPPAM